MQNRDSDIDRIIRDGRLIDQVIVVARHRVIRRYRQLGIPLVVWKDGQAVELDPNSPEVIGYENEDLTEA